MGQDLVIICKKCKTITMFMCRFSNISKKDVQEYFEEHKGHDIKPCGDDSGWGLLLSKLQDEGYKIERSWKK